MATLIIARKMKWISGLLAFLLTFPAYAADPWTPTQKALAVAYTGLVLVDRGQTMRGSVEHPDQYNEMNPILGSNPSARTVNIACAVSIVGAIGIAHVLPSRYRTTWLGSISVVELAVVSHNYRIGLAVSF